MLSLSRPWLHGFLFFAVALPAVGQTLTVRPSRPESLFRKGEKVSWLVESSDASRLSNVTFTVKRGGLTEVASGKPVFSINRAVVEYQSTEPGALLLEVKATAGSGAGLSASGGAVVDSHELGAAMSAPADFDRFWTDQLAALALVPVRAEVTVAASGRSDVSYGTVKIDSISSTSVRGQWAKPTREGKFPGLVIFQWAGVYSLDRSWVTGYAAQGWLVLNTQAHDINPVDVSSYYTDLQNGALKDYWRIGNEDRETSYFRRMYLSCHRAVEYLSQREDWDGKTIVVMGASQGGQQAIVAAALHDKVTGLVVAVPAGGDQDGVDVGRAPAFPSWAYQAWDRNLAKVRSTGRYFDTLHFAPKIRCPSLLGVGLLDTVVPPTSVYATYNRITAPRTLISMPLADHQNNQSAYSTAQAEWLSFFLNGQRPIKMSAPRSAFKATLSGRPINLSVFGPAGTQGSTLIGGFSIAGTGSKTLLLRAAGPSLTQFGVTNYLADPLLRLHSSDDRVLAENDDWSMLDDVNHAGAGAFQWAAGSPEASMVVTLPPGNYTAQVVNRGDGAPLSILEIYDLSKESTSLLYNVSCRILQQPETPVIVGVVLDQSVPLLVRNAGPALVPLAGLSSAAADTRLKIFDGQVLSQMNDDWDSGLAETFLRLGAFSFFASRKDAALLLPSPPTQITAHANTVGQSGVGIVEVYLAK